MVERTGDDRRQIMRRREPTKASAKPEHLAWLHQFVTARPSG
jgi:hypothetical protein